MIAVRNLEKSVKSGAGETFLLRRINLDIKPGEFVSIMGPSGAGKSTLLHILGMHDTDWRGEYELHGQPVHTLRQKDRLALQKKHIGFVFQSYHLLDNLTVYENLEVPLSYRDVPRAQRQSIVSDVLDRFQIVAKKDLYPSQLSGGQQQLVGVARAVVANPGADPRRRADRQPPLRSGARDHGAVQEAQRRGHDDHPGDALGGERPVRQPRHQAARWVDRAMTPRSLVTAYRSIRRTPVLSLAAMLSLAVGIGANAAIFSIFNQTLLRQLPVQQPEQLVTFGIPGRQAGCARHRAMPAAAMPWSAIRCFATSSAGSRSFTGIAAHREISANIAHRSRTSNETALARVRQLLSGSWIAAGARPIAHVGRRSDAGRA